MKNRNTRDSINKVLRKHPTLMYIVPVLMIIAMIALLSLTNAVASSSAGASGTDNTASEVNWAKNFGGADYSYFISTTADGSGYVAVGTSFSNGDWTGTAGKYSIDAIIVKFDTNDNVTWVKNFGGLGHDGFDSVVAVSDGYVAVGLSEAGSFGNGDWAGVSGKGNYDATIVKFDTNGNVTWAKNFGGRGEDQFVSVIAVDGGYVAVGISESGSFGNGDWAGATGNGDHDAIMVKFDTDGNVIWAKNFGGLDYDVFFSVTADSSGYVAVGYSGPASFGNGDWVGIAGKGGEDAIMVKFDTDGNVIWAKNFGGNSDDQFSSVTADSSGYVAAGTSWTLSFGNGDWTDITGVNSPDGIIVKFGTGGSVEWKNCVGWSAGGMLYSVITVDGGYVAAGNFLSTSSGSDGGSGAIINFDTGGNLKWEKDFGENDENVFSSVTAVSDGYVVAGYSFGGSFSNGGLVDFSGKGGIDAIIVKFGTTPETIPSNDLGYSASNAILWVGIAAAIIVIIAVIAAFTMNRGRTI